MSKSVPYTAVFLLFLSLGLAQPRQARAQCQVVVTTADSVGCVGDTLTLTATVPTAANTLTAATAAGNSHRGNMFNLTAINNITVTGFEVSPMGITNYEIYYRVGSYVGFETSSAGWTLVGTATNVPAGPNPNFQLVTLQTPVNIPAGQTYGFYVTSTNVAVSQNYSNGTAVNNVFASDANVQFREGCGLEYPFSAGGGTFTPRVFNGRIRYTTSASYTYLWSTGQTTQTISHVLTGTGGVGVTVTQTSPACSATDTIPLTALPSPTVNLPGTATLCAGDTLTLDAGNPGSTYLWSNAAATQTIDIVAAGIYNVTVTDANGCTGSNGTLVVLAAPPTVDLGPDTTLCEGTATLLDAGNPGLNFVWSTGQTAQAVAVSTSGQYSVTVTDPQSGCEGHDTVTVTALAVPTVDLGPDQSICPDDVVPLDAGNPGFLYLWSSTDTTQLIYVGPGPYSVTVTDPSTGCSATDAVTLAALPLPTAAFSYTHAGQQTNFANASTNSVNFAWDFGDGAGSTSLNPTHAYGANGTYTVTLIATNVCGADTFILSVDIDYAIGTPEAASRLALALHPNPASQLATLRFASLGGAATVRLLNPAGQAVAVHSLGNLPTGQTSLPLPLQGLAPGLYLVQVEQAGARAALRLVVQP